MGRPATIRFAAAATALGALLGLTTACGGAGSSAPTVTTTVTAPAPDRALPAACADALTKADAMGQSYATYLGLTGKMFDAVARSDMAAINEQAGPLSEHISSATTVAQAYATARDACRTYTSSASSR